MFDDLKKILKEALLYEAIDASVIQRAMDRNKRVIIRYTGEDGISTTRQVEIFAFGLSTAGNEVIRAFQVSNRPTAHKTESGEWKMFRLDRITDLKITPYDISELYPYIRKELFNKNGDRSMRKVYRIFKSNISPKMNGGEYETSPNSKISIGATPEKAQSIGTYTTKRGDRLNIIGLKQRGNHTLAITDKGGHLFINTNSMNYSGNNAQEPNNDNNTTKPGAIVSDDSWSSDVKDKVLQKIKASMDTNATEPIGSDEEKEKNNSNVETNTQV